MARRYGGRFSPPGAEDARRPDKAARRPRLRNRRVRAVGGRARLLYVFPVPLFFAGLGATLRGSPIEAAVELGGFAGLMLAAWLTGQGLRAEAEFEARAVAKPPVLPRKMLAAALTGFCVFALGAASLGQGFAGAVVFGLMAAAAHFGSFGPDPLRAKGLAGADAPAAERAARAVEEAEAVVRDTLSAASQLRDRRLEGRIGQLADKARDVLREIERDPRDLSRARRFLSVYLVGLRDATRKFADLSAPARQGTPREQYEALLADMETSFEARRTALLEERTGELELEIEVLRERLQQDGLTAR